MQRNYMSCTRPLVRIPTSDGDFRVVSLKGYLNHSGKNLEFIADKAQQDLNEKKIKELIKDQKAQLLPCGQCPGCKMAAASSWANRMELELPYHQNAWFITFTYDDDNIPYRMTWDEGTGEVLVENYSLRYEDMQKFWKRLRRYMEYHKINNGKLMYFQCGEYGGKTHRPHYHAIVYDIPFTKEDLKVYKKKNGAVYYNVDWFTELWGMGHVVIAAAEWKAMAYTARYTTKKVYGKEGKEFYKELGILPEKCNMSKRPAIGAKYFEEHSEEIYAKDKIQLKNGKVCKPPRYFDKLYDAQCLRKPLTDKEVEDIELTIEKAESDELKTIKRKRRKLANDALFARLKQNNGLTMQEYYNKEEQKIQDRFKKLIREEI